MAERDERGGGGAADAAGAEDEVVGHGWAPSSNVSTAHESRMARSRWNKSRAVLTFIPELWQARRHGHAHRSGAPQPAAVEADILRVAREHLATTAPRRSACVRSPRDLGMVSSGIYRYVESRDELLTRLIVDSYMSLAACGRLSPRQPFRPTTSTVDGTRSVAPCASWALANPHDFALIYGSPVPDYAAPGERTVGPGTAVLAILVQLLDDALRAGRMPDPPRADDLSSRAVGDLLADDLFAGLDVDAHALARGLSAWTLLLGAVTSELFHQLGPLEDPEALFEWQLARAKDLFLTASEDRT